MDENLKLCQTCLSNDRIMYPLANLKRLLKQMNIEIPTEGGACWECRRLLEKFFAFRSQIYRAQVLLNGCEKIENLKPLSTLSSGKKYFYYSHFDPKANLSITCTETGPILIKQEVTESANDERQEVTTSEKENRVENRKLIKQKSNEINQMVEEDHVNNMSELPRITLVESITDQTTEPNKESQSITEIIELNIPIPHPILVEDDVSTENQSTVTEDHGSMDNHSNLAEDELVENDLVQKDNSVLSEDSRSTEMCHEIVNSDNQKEGTTRNRLSRRENEFTENKSNSCEEEITTDHFSVLVDKDSSNKNRVERSDTTEIRTNSEENGAHSSNNDDVHVNKKPAKSMDAIIIKVAFIGRLPGTEVKIKEEPVSDHEDLQIDADDGLNESNEELNNDVKVEDLSINVKHKYDQWKKSIMLVYNTIRGHKYASRFIYPITDAIAPEYSKVVKRPIDLSTIRKNVKSGVIRTTSEFQRDLLLMLSNALMYNSSHHSIYNMTKDLLEEVKYQLGLLLTVHAHSTLPDDTPFQRPKRHLDNVFKQPAAKSPRTSYVTPKVENTTVTPTKRRRYSTVTPKFEKLTPTPKKRPRVSVTTKVEKTPNVGPAKRPKVSTVIAQSDKMPTLIPKVEKLTFIPKMQRISPTKVTQKISLTSRNEKKSNITPEVDIIPIKSSKVDKRSASKVGMSTRSSTIDKLPTPVPKVATTSTRKIGTPEVFKIPTVTPKIEKKSTRTRKVNRKYSNPDLETYLSSKVKIEPMLIPKVEKKSKSQRKARYNYEEDDIMCGSQTLDDFCVVITTKPQRDLTRDEASFLKKTLEEKILNIALDFSVYAPRFRGKPIIADGVVKLWCEDKKSLTWLRKTITKLPKNMGKFVVKKQAEMPKKIKSALVVPGYNGEVEVIRKLLKVQNPWAQVDSWAVYSAEQRGESMFLTIGIPSTLIPTLLGRQRRLAYILGSVYVKFYDLGGKLNDLPPELS